MNLYANQLAQHLKKPISFYILVGQDPFLINQSYQLLRQYATQHHFDERLIFTYEGSSNFDWQGLHQSLSSASIFSDKQIIEWTWQNTKFDDAALNELLPLLPPNKDSLLIVKAGALTKAQQNAKWFKNFSANAAIISHWPPKKHEWPQLIAQLAKQKNLVLPQDACLFLSAQYEGRLQALEQHLEKISLYESGEISMDLVRQHLDEQKDLDVFDLQSALLHESKEQTIDILNHLKQNKTELTLVLWCLSRLLESLILAQNASSPKNEHWLKSRGIWSHEHALFWRLAKNVKINKLDQWMSSLHELDQDAKTGHVSECWQKVCFICLNLTGALPHVYR